MNEDTLSKWKANFLNKYEPDSLIQALGRKRIYYGDSKKRKCRFCGNTNLDSFKGTAHLVPQLLGNRDLISNYECDICNSTFSNYESSLSNYLGAYIAFEYHWNIGKRKARTFTDPDHSIKIYSTEKGVCIDDPENKISHFDENKNLLTINTRKHPFKSVYVYKIFLKIFLSLLRDEQLTHFTRIINFIKDESAIDEGVLSHSKITIFKLDSSDFSSDYPLLYTYKRKNLETNVPFITFIVGFKNFMFQVFPFCDVDQDKFSLNREIHFPIHPPAYYDNSGNWSNLTNPHIATIDFNSYELTKDEFQEIHIFFT